MLSRIRGDGVHVLFDDVTDSGPYYTRATFNESDIATLDRSSAHTIRFSIDFKTGPANDVVKIYVDNVLKATGTTWEDYYRYDNESQGAGQVPLVSKLLFRASGTANLADAGKGFLVDGVSLASTPCAPTGLVRDGIDLTARQIGGIVTGTTIDASGCNIGVYYGPGTTGSVTNANISGANYYGVVVNAAAVNVTTTIIHDIGETPLNGSQHGVGVLYTTINQAGTSTGTAATGTLSGNTITKYQKNGVVVSGTGAAVTVQGNTVTGEGPISYIAQNGIQISFGATARVFGNIVTANDYLPAKVTGCGLLIYKAGGVSASTKAGISYIKAENTILGNETDICNFGKGGSYAPA